MVRAGILLPARRFGLSLLGLTLQCLFEASASCLRDCGLRADGVVKHRGVARFQPK
jgi:hypothetical protein